MASHKEETRQENLDLLEASEYEQDKSVPLEVLGVEFNGPSRLANYAIITASIIIILAGIYFARGVLTPIFIAAFFAVILYTPFSFLTKRIGFSRIAAAFVISGVVLILGVIVTTILSTQLKQFSKKLPDYWSSFDEKLTSYHIDINEIFPFLEKDKRENVPQSDGNPGTSQLPIQLPGKDGHVTPIRSLASAGGSASVQPASLEEHADRTESDDSDAVSEISSAPKNPENNPDISDDASEEQVVNRYGEEISPPMTPAEVPEKAIRVSTKQVFSYMGDYVGKLTSFASVTFLVVLLLIFMMVEVARLPDKVKNAIGAQENERLHDVLEDIRKYMTIKTYVSLIVGVCVAVFLWFMQVQYWALWGLLAFFLNFIPNIGSVAASIPPIILATVEHGTAAGIVVIIGMAAINCIVGYVLEPKLLGNGLDLSPLVVLISLIVWGTLLGPVGMFLSPPLAVICKIILQQFPETEWIATLMANGVPIQKKVEKAEKAE